MMTVHVLALLMSVTSAAAQSAPQAIVFVCEHGAAKSVVAATHFNKLAAERGLPFRAISRGTAPDPSVPVRITDGLKSEGLALPPAYKPALVTAADVNGAARVVTFDVTLPVPYDPSRTSQWDKLPAFSEGYGPASAAIAAKVDQLLRDLERTSKKQPRVQ